MKTGIEIILEERIRQFESEGHTLENDLKQHDGSENLAMAAASYALPNSLKDTARRLFPWVDEYYKPTPNDRVKQLAKAGALIAAEIDRLQQLKQE